MPFDMNSLTQSLEEYLVQNVTIKIINYIGDTQPIGGVDQGVNFDVGETHSFDLQYANNGNLGILNLIANVKCKHGKLSTTFSGLSNLAGSQWTEPWNSSLDVRPCNLGPNETITWRHEQSGGHLLGYQLTSPTGGSDNNRDIETLLTAKIIRWQPDLQNLTLGTKRGPIDILESFIQRT